MCFVSKQIFQSTLRFNIKLLLIIIITVTNTVIAIVYMIICIIYMYHLFVSFICIIYLYHLYDHLYILFDESYVFHREIWSTISKQWLFSVCIEATDLKKKSKSARQTYHLLSLSLLLLHYLSWSCQYTSTYYAPLLQYPKRRSKTCYDEDRKFHCSSHLTSMLKLSEKQRFCSIWASKMLVLECCAQYIPTSKFQRHFWLVLKKRCLPVIRFS